MEPVELDALCYLVLIVSEATIQALALDEELAQRHPEIPWREIRATGDRLRYGYATIDLQVVHQVVEKGHIDQLLELARTELGRAGDLDSGSGWKAPFASTSATIVSARTGRHQRRNHRVGARASERRRPQQTDGNPHRLPGPKLGPEFPSSPTSNRSGASRARCARRRVGLAARRSPRCSASRKDVSCIAAPQRRRSSPARSPFASATAAASRDRCLTCATAARVSRRMSCTKPYLAGAYGQGGSTTFAFSLPEQSILALVRTALFDPVLPFTISSRAHALSARPASASGGRIRRPIRRLAALRHGARPVCSAERLDQRNGTRQQFWLARLGHRFALRRLVATRGINGSPGIVVPFRALKTVDSGSQSSI
jgi:uncharacterized protein with HEPN domain